MMMSYGYDYDLANDNDGHSHTYMRAIMHMRRNTALKNNKFDVCGYDHDHDFPG